ncbi:MAG TPA: hypothetical protein VEZ14_02660 [Dehalococcoidia bacterium]|nr:hypothetical protein [Dehalococcoidia bacterium]
MKQRIAVALAIALAIYGVALGTGTLLYRTGVIATGATHNNCADFRAQLAAQRGVSEQDVPQSDVAAATAQCLTGHTLTKWEAFRSEYLLWSAWPALICALVFLAWPAWAGVLERQEAAGRGDQGRPGEGMA